MNRLVEHFGPEVKKSGFLGEWSLFVERGMDPGITATMLVEYLRSENDKERNAFISMLGYMRTRPWAEFLLSMFDFLTPEEVAMFQRAGAEEFYKKLALLCSLQVEDYWGDFLAEKNKRAKEAMESLEAMPVTELDLKIRTVIQQEVEQSICGLPEKMAGEIRRLLDEQSGGDEWKKDIGGAP